MELVTVGEFVSAFEAESARQFLEANGIHACISGGIPVFTGDGAGFMGGVLQVAEQDRERAADLLRKAAKHKSEARVGPAWEATFIRVVLWSLVVIVPVGLAFAVLASWFRWW